MIRWRFAVAVWVSGHVNVLALLQRAKLNGKSRRIDKECAKKTGRRGVCWGPRWGLGARRAQTSTYWTSLLAHVLADKETSVVRVAHHQAVATEAGR